MKPFKAFVVDKLVDNQIELKVTELTINDLPEGDVIIEVQYSSVNYKDGLASISNGGIVRNYPFVPGIDLAGVVLVSNDSRYKIGDEVLVTGYDLGVNHYGGYSEIARVPGDWIVPIPDGLTMKETMAIGTAGFTAALSIHRLEENGLSRDKGTVLVTGASGGVGSSAIGMLKKLGYTITASTRKTAEHDYLKQIGASEIISLDELSNPKKRPLLKQRWAACIDPVAGEYLPTILSSIQYGGSVALSGLTAGNNFTSTVFPFILRGVNLLGIDSVFCPMETRLAIWNRLAKEMKPDNLLESIAHEITLEQLPQGLQQILNGEMKGRTIVKLS
ncbi:NADPH:quinone oxidoreductase family protein [Bacillus andreraoultii]|uniref:NADPH:quinone oxidoreductase family protein n=1 Tax=Bacillus andreraoultii TaxID=1499685 RepID=UPI00053B247E|nr:acryloyl-CoA reductase [Bacillus andreraoultii]